MDRPPVHPEVQTSRLRQTKKRVLEAIQAEDWLDRLEDLQDIPPGQKVGPLFSFLLYPGEIRWRAIAALGRVVARWAAGDMNDGRKIIRRIMWNLNEESASVAWGQPEAMGEILASEPTLAREFYRILVSYAWNTGKSDNYLDHDLLRRGAYWGIGRLCEARPDLMAEAAGKALVQGLADPDAHCRGLSALALCLLGRLPEAQKLEAAEGLKKLLQDSTHLEFYRNQRFYQATVEELAREALESLSGKESACLSS